MFTEIVLPMLVVAVLTIVLAPIVGCVAGLYYAGLILVRAVRVLADGYGIRQGSSPALIPTPPKKRVDAREPAHLHYPADQAWRDAWHTLKLGRSGVSEIVTKNWRQVVSQYFPDEPTRKANGTQLSTRWSYPIGVGLVLGIGVGVLIAGVALLLALLGTALMLGLLYVGAFIARYLLRGVDTALLYVRGITLTCKYCARRVPFPEYSCPGCHVRHSDVRPGQYGLTHRTCGCGKRFPSLLILKSYALEGWCPHCERPLAKDTGAAAEIVIPVFGATGAGKTQLMIVLMIVVEALACRGRGRFEFADETTRDWSTAARRMLTTHRQAPKTDKQALQPAFSLHVSPPKGARRLIHVFDAAGEIFLSSQRIQQLRQLTIARTFVFVVDPLSLSRVWQSLDEQLQVRLKEVKASTEPQKVFAETIQTVHKMGIDTGKIRLVVVVSKADLITAILNEVGDDDESIRKWLCEKLEQENMVRAMDHNFRDVSFFLTTALTDEHDIVDHSVEKFVVRTLAEEGLRF